MKNGRAAASGTQLAPGKSRKPGDPAMKKTLFALAVLSSLAWGRLSLAANDGAGADRVVRSNPVEFRTADLQNGDRATVQDVRGYRYYRSPRYYGYRTLPYTYRALPYARYGRPYSYDYGYGPSYRWRNYYGSPYGSYYRGPYGSRGGIYFGFGF
jgi:hypothetical protein